MTDPRTPELDALRKIGLGPAIDAAAQGAEARRKDIAAELAPIDLAVRRHVGEHPSDTLPALRRYLDQVLAAVAGDSSVVVIRGVQAQAHRIAQAEIESTRAAADYRKFMDRVRSGMDAAQHSLAAELERVCRPDLAALLARHEPSTGVLLRTLGAQLPPYVAKMLAEGPAEIATAAGAKGTSDANAARVAASYARALASSIEVQLVGPRVEAKIRELLRTESGRIEAEVRAEVALELAWPPRPAAPVDPAPRVSRTTRSQARATEG